MASKKLKLTEKSTIKILYQSLYDMATIFDSVQLKYWAISGTLLGAVRHQGIIPWDDDGDVAILGTDVKQFLKLRSAFKKCGYAISEKLWFGYKIYPLHGKKIPGEKYLFPSIDIILYKKVGNRYVQVYKAARDTWPKEYFYQTEMYPGRYYKFGEFELPGITHPEKYMNRMYGHDWNKVAYRQYDHSKEEFVKSVKVRLTDADRVPAVPTKIVHRHCLPKEIKTMTAFERKIGLRSIRNSCRSDRNCKDNFDLRAGVYVINCKIHDQRLKNFKKYMRKAGIKSCQEICVNGKKFTDNVICKMLDENLVSDKASMTPIEVAIFMSHYNAWTRIVNSCEQYGIVFEDDVIARKNLGTNIEAILNKIEQDNIDLSVFWLHNGNWMDTKKKLHKAFKIGKLEVKKESINYNASGSAYIISSQYARYLIDNAFPIRWPVDIYMGDHYTIGQHLTLVMKYDRTAECYRSPLLGLDCGGEHGTGISTQNYNAPTVRKISKHC